MRSCPHCFSPYSAEVEFCGLDGTRIREYEADPLIGSDIERYRIVDLLGHGAMARVYRATHRVLDHAYALKVLFGEIASHRELAERFRREAQVISKMNHPNVVSVIDFGTTPAGLTFLTMELLFGKTLRDLLRREAPFPPLRAAGILRQIAAGLEEAHGRGFVHRDLKPSNVMIVDGDPPEHVKILDFGLAHAAHEDLEGPHLTKTGQFLGTPTYMAPEQMTGEEVTPQTDLYALGVVLFEMLEGGPPFKGRKIADIRKKHLSESPPPMRAALGLEILAHQLLEKDPTKRPGSAKEVIAHADRLIANRTLFVPSVEAFGTQTTEVTVRQEFVPRATGRDTAEVPLAPVHRDTLEVPLSALNHDAVETPRSAPDRATAEVPPPALPAAASATIDERGALTGLRSVPTRPSEAAGAPVAFAPGEVPLGLDGRATQDPFWSPASPPLLPSADQRTPLLNLTSEASSLRGGTAGPTGPYPSPRLTSSMAVVDFAERSQFELDPATPPLRAPRRRTAATLLAVAGGLAVAGLLGVAALDQPAERATSTLSATSVVANAPSGAFDSPNLPSESPPVEAASPTSNLRSARPQSLTAVGEEPSKGGQDRDDAPEKARPRKKRSPSAAALEAVITGELRRRGLTPDDLDLIPSLAPALKRWRTASASKDGAQMMTAQADLVSAIRGMPLDTAIVRRKLSKISEALRKTSSNVSPDTLAKWEDRYLDLAKAASAPSSDVECALLAARAEELLRAIGKEK